MRGHFEVEVEVDNDVPGHFERSLKAVLHRLNSSLAFFHKLVQKMYSLRSANFGQLLHIGKN